MKETNETKETKETKETRETTSKSKETKRRGGEDENDEVDKDPHERSTQRQLRQKVQSCRPLAAPEFIRGHHGALYYLNSIASA